MQEYTIPTKEQCQQYNVDEKGLDIIKEYISAYQAYDKAGDALGDYFKGMYLDKIINAITLEELVSIKNGLRIMPESVNKTLLFRSIIIKEDEIKKMKRSLTTEQLTKASEWYKSHKEHVDKLVKSVTTHYPPTDTEDKNSPALWKANHWAWFLNK